MTAQPRSADMRATQHTIKIRRSAIAGVTLVTADTARAFGRHTHDEFGIGLIDRGAQVSASGRGPVEAAAGDVITVNPNEVHDGLALAGQPRRWRMLYLSPEIVGQAARTITQGASREAELAFPAMRSAACTSAFEALHAVAASAERASSGRNWRDLLQDHWNERLLLLLGEVLDAAPARAAPLPGAITRIRARIDADPADDAPLEELARAAGLSRFQLVRAFSTHLGLPPHAYRVQKRIHLARRLIGEGRALAEAAITAGFADQAHMTRALTRAYGLTPGALARA
jgi:AraC-like DNA-binding protein/quercetin dioxygenase-like cupin family protein